MSLLAAAISINFLLVSVSKSLQEIAFPSFLGPWTLKLSYKPKTEAFTLALALPLVVAKALFSILIGRPSRVLTKTLAKSNPSAIVVA